MSRLTSSHRVWDNLEHGMPSSPLDKIHGRTTSSVAGHHRLSTAYTGSADFGSGMLSLPLDSIHATAPSSMACYHCPWKAHMIVLYRAWKCYICPWAAQTVKHVGR